jgi:SAM-dependent methyltransferase
VDRHRQRGGIMLTAERRVEPAESVPRQSAAAAPGGGGESAEAVGSGDAAPVLVNLGCGSVHHPAWLNFDFASRDPAVRKADLRRRLPFADGAVDAVYHSHVLEHLDRDDAARFLAENARVLRPGGVLRVVVPDLEELCRTYLAALAGVERGEAGARELYEWSQLDLLDQMVRRRSCGAMPAFLASVDLSRNPRVAERLTIEMEGHAGGAPQTAPGGVLARLKRSGWRGLPHLARRASARLRRETARAAVRAIAGRAAAAAFEEGSFRAIGEVHRWMYDRYSLGRALRAAGLTAVAFKGVAESDIPGFAGYDLDSVGGRVRKPGSLFAEARKP